MLGKHSASTIEIEENDLIQNGPINKEFTFLLNMGLIPSSSEWESVRKNFDNGVLNDILINAGKYDFFDFEHEQQNER